MELGLNPLSAGRSFQTLTRQAEEAARQVLIPYQQGGLFRRKHFTGGVRISKVLIPYQQGGLFRLTATRL